MTAVRVCFCRIAVIKSQQSFHDWMNTQKARKVPSYYCDPSQGISKATPKTKQDPTPPHHPEGQYLWHAGSDGEEPVVR